jgi:hypothetical protein
MTDVEKIPIEIQLQTSPEGPHILYEAFASGRVPLEKLRDLVMSAWCYHCLSAPEEVIGSDKWVQMFRTTGLIVVPSWLNAPTGPETVYRGTHAAGCRGMSWTVSCTGAGYYRDGRLKRGHDSAHIYRTSAPVEAVLALWKQGADSVEYVLDPSRLGEIELVE